MRTGTLWAQSEYIRSWLDKRVREAISGSQGAAAEYVLGPRRIAKCQSESESSFRQQQQQQFYITAYITALLVLLFKLNLAKKLCIVINCINFAVWERLIA